jgi:pimeloyl-ACP methyl ester carboxylesterase
MNHRRLARGTRRRHLLQGGTLAGVGLLASACATPTAVPPRSPFVLVHGAWYGGWCWRKLTPLLERAGHAVYTPTLTGLGERAHQGRADTGLREHVQDLLAVLEMEDLHDVTLVGHSYAGFVIGTVAARARARVRQLIYLDAFVPEPGQRVVNYLLPLDRRQAIVAAGEANGFIAPIPPQALGVTDAADIAWITPRVTRQPYASFSQPALEQSGADVPRSYIACTQPASGSFGQFAARVRQDSTWRYHELATGHNAMVSAPQALSQVLLQWAA